MKKRLAVLLMVFLACIAVPSILLASGTRDAAQAPGGEPNLMAPKTIRWLTIWPQDYKARDTYTIMELTKLYQKERNPNLHVVPDVIDIDNMLQKVQVLVASDSLPEIYIYEAGTPLWPLIDGGLALNFETTLKSLGILDELETAAIALLKTLSGGRGLYALPLGLNIEGIWYNKRMFREYSLTIPQTWDDLMSICEKLNSKGVIPFLPAGKDKWPSTRFINMLAMRIMGPHVMEAAGRGEVSFLDTGFINAGTIIEEMVTKGYFGKGVNSVDYAASLTSFLEEKVAMYYMGSWAASDFNDPAVNKHMYPDGIGYFNFPVVTGGKGKTTDYCANCGTVFCANAKKYDAQVGDWLKFVFSRLGDFDMKETGKISGWKIRNPPKEVPPYTQLVLDEFEKVKDTGLWWEAFMDPRTTEIAQDNYQLMIAGQMNARSYFKLIEDSNQAYLKQKK